MKTVRQWMGLRRKTEGDVGLEIEVEGINLPHTGEYWNVTHDGSLRGEALEYVLKRPMSLSEGRKALDYLAHQYKENEATIHDSARCGVHVHVNCQELSIVQLYNFFVLYLVMEELLVEWCGKTRVGNLFCLRAKDAEYLLWALEQSANDKEFRRRFGSDELRYASMNVKALTTYGSLEFRAMRGTEDMNLIYQWADILVGLREHAKALPCPSEIIMQMSMGGGKAFLRNVLGEHVDTFLAMDDWEAKLHSGMRYAQDVAFATDWEEMVRADMRQVGGVAVPHNFDDDFPPEDV